MPTVSTNSQRFASDRLYCLTIDAEWVWAILEGHKRVENRTWPTHYRGLLALHAARARRSRRIVEQLWPEVPRVLPRRAIVGLAELVDVVRVEDEQIRLAVDPLAVGPWCWVLRNARRLPAPIPLRGQQGIWPVPPAIDEQLRLWWAQENFCWAAMPSGPSLQTTSPSAET